MAMKNTSASKNEPNIVKIEPKRDYKSKKNSDIVNLPVDLGEDFFSLKAKQKLSEAPSTTEKIILNILNELYITHKSFQDENNDVKLSIYDTSFLTENNTYTRFTFNISEIDTNLNYNQVKEGLEFLEGLDKGWHKAKNSKGKTVSSYGGVISNANISDGKISFLMSSHWVDKFLKHLVYLLEKRPRKQWDVLFSNARSHKDKQLLIPDVLDKDNNDEWTW